MSSKIVVVIPVYKPFRKLTENERKSFTQALLILNRRPLTLICPESLSVAAYIEYAELTGVHLSVRRFKDAFFSDIAGYNKLMLSNRMYRTLIEYNYMLIYQLDAWVFYDELDYWTEMGYDYVGAPLFEHFDKNTNYKFINGQNGGFSLRSVQKSIWMLETINKARSWYQYVKNNTGNRERLANKITAFAFSLFRCNIRETVWLRDILNKHFPNEDYVWSAMISETFSSFKVCPTEEAMKFSFEYHPSFLYQRNGRALPMGVHAWEKYEPDFWRSFIK